MKRRSFITVTALAMLSACGSDDPATNTAGGVSDPPDDAESTASGAGSGSASGGTVLIGSVGTAEDPDAFEIALTTEDGEPVESIPAGDYSIRVDDPSTIHNFHLVGGSVDETTSVSEKTQTTFEVTLEPGEYTYTCDPHPPMTGTFAVT